MNTNITVADLLSELYCYRKLFSTFPLIRIENPTRAWSKQRIIHITVVNNEFPRVALWKLMHRRTLLNGAWHSNVLNFPVLSLTLSWACCSSLATDVHTDTSARFSHLQAGANELSQSPICLHQPRWLSVETEPSCSPSFMSLFPHSPPFSLCPFVISLSLILTRPLTLSIPLLPFISHHVYILSLYLTLSIFLLSVGLFWSSLKHPSQQQEPSLSVLSHKPLCLSVSPSCSFSLQRRQTHFRGCEGDKRTVHNAEFKHGVCSCSMNVWYTGPGTLSKS